MPNFCTGLGADRVERVGDERRRRHHARSSDRAGTGCIPRRIGRWLGRRRRRAARARAAACSARGTARSSIVQDSSQWLIGTSIATAPPAGAQHEADRDRQHVENDDVLQRPGVERAAARGRSTATSAEAPAAARYAAAERADAEHAPRCRCAERRRQRPGRDRPRALERVLPIGFAIGDVVDQIDDARQRAEDDERAERAAAIARGIEAAGCAERSARAKTIRFFVHCAGRSDTSEAQRQRRPGRDVPAAAQACS